MIANALQMNIQLATNVREAITRLQAPEPENSALLLICNIKSGAVELQSFYEKATLEKVSAVS